MIITPPALRQARGVAGKFARMADRQSTDPFRGKAAQQGLAGSSQRRHPTSAATVWAGRWPAAGPGHEPSLRCRHRAEQGRRYRDACSVADVSRPPAHYKQVDPVRVHPVPDLEGVDLDVKPARRAAPHDGDHVAAVTVLAHHARLKVAEHELHLATLRASFACRPSTACGGAPSGLSSTRGRPGTLARSSASGTGLHVCAQVPSFLGFDRRRDRWCEALACHPVPALLPAKYLRTSHNM